MTDVAEKLLELVERRRTLLAEVARIEAAFARAITDVEEPKLLGAVPRVAGAKTRKPPTGDGPDKKATELRDLAPHFEVLVPAERTVIEARVAGKLPEQIAQDLGRTASSVSTTIYLAKKKLLAARESHPSGDKPTTPPASDDEEPPAPGLTTISTPRSPRKVREPRKPCVSEPAGERSKDANFAAFTSAMRQHSVLNREEELELFLRWKQTGDRRLADRLVSANLRLVLSIAKQYHRRRHDLLDLVQEGSIGLFHALSKFDPTRGARFTSFATWWIRAYIFKFILANHHLVRIGTTQEQRKLFFNLHKTRMMLEKDGAPATVEQIAEALEVDTVDVAEMEMHMGAAVTPLDAPLPADADSASPRHYEFPADEARRPDIMAEANDFQHVAERHVAAFGRTLTDRHHTIFVRRLIAEDPATLNVLADEMGITRERVRQIESEIKDRLRKYLRQKMHAGDLVT